MDFERAGGGTNRATSTTIIRAITPLVAGFWILGHGLDGRLVDRLGAARTTPGSA